MLEITHLCCATSENIKEARLKNETNMIPERPAEQFYSWERHGRGWKVNKRRAQLEPPLIIVPQRAKLPIADDAQIESFWTRLFASRNRVAATPATPNQREAEDFKDSGDLVQIGVELPPDLRVMPETAESFLLSLSHCAFPISFEIIGLGDHIKVQFCCRASDSGMLEQQLLAHFPDLALTAAPDRLAAQWTIPKRLVAIEFGLTSEFVRPLATFRTFEPDPLIAICGALSKLRTDEVAMMQVLFQATRQPWAERIAEAITNHEGKPLFIDAPELTTLARQKIARPLFAAVIRAAAQGSSEDRTWRIVRGLSAALRRFANPASNNLIALSNDDYSQSEHEVDLFSRATHRSGLLLNSEELAGLVHVPSASLRSEKLRRHVKKTRPAPAFALGHSLILGHNTHRGHTAEITLSPEQRMRHVFIAGSTGSGKSTLIKSMAAQDISNGDGCCVIDPHADLINDLLAQVPEERHDDVIVFDPADESPVPFNVLSAHSELERNLLASDLTSIFRRQCTTWGDQMDAVLTNSILAFLDSDRASTLADLRRFLVEAEYRKDFLRSIKDEELVYYWTREFPLLRGRPQAPILTRLNAFLRPKPIRAMVSQQSGSLDLRHIIDSKKILFVRLGQGTIGVENAQLLGSLVLSKLHQAALSRQDVDEAERTKVNIYVDECQFFLAPSVTALLSGGRKHGVGIVLATQEFFALWNADKEIASSVLTNPFTRICFRLGDTDAKRLADGVAHFDKDDLQNLAIGEAIVRLQTNENDFNLKTLPPQTIDPQEAKARREKIISLSRAKYGRAPEQSMAPSSMTTTRVPVEPVPVYKHADPVRQLSSGYQAAPDPPRSNAPEIVASLGRGGHEHKYLQHLIKRLADSQGFCVTIEQPVLGNTGSVDVVLEKGTRKIACEISITSTPDYELKNIEKCLAAGFDPVLVLASNKRQLARIKKLAHNSLLIDSLTQVLFVQPDELPSLLEHYGQEDPTTEATVKGYKVKVKQRAITGGEADIRKTAISQVLLKSLNRLRQDDKG